MQIKFRSFYNYRLKTGYLDHEIDMITFINTSIHGIAQLIKVHYLHVLESVNHKTKVAILPYLIFTECHTGNELKTF